MDICLLLVGCQAEVSAMSIPPVQRSPTDWDASLCDLHTSRIRRPWPAFGLIATGGRRGKPNICKLKEKLGQF